MESSRKSMNICKVPHLTLRAILSRAGEGIERRIACRVAFFQLGDMRPEAGVRDE